PRGAQVGAVRRRQRFLEKSVDLLVAPALLVLPDERGGAHEQRALERGVARALRLLDEARRDVVPLLRGLLDLLDGLLDVVVAGPERERALVGAARALVVEQLLAVDAAELLEQARGAVGIARREARE